MSDPDIDTSDCPSLNENFFQRARIRRPESVPVTVKVDPAVLAWFQGLGDRWEARMSAALRLYAEARQASDAPAA